MRFVRLDQNEAISEDEADGLFLTELFVKNSGNHMEKFKFTRDIHRRRVQVAHLYVKMYRWICHGLEVCGLSYFTVSSPCGRSIQSLSSDSVRLQDLITFDASYFHAKMSDFDDYGKESAMKELKYGQGQATIFSYRKF